MRVLIAEDQLLLRDGLTRMLTAYGLDVVAVVDDGAHLTDALISVRPDVAVIDVRLPPTFTDEGLRAAIAARRAVAGLPVLILSQFVDAIRQVAAGGTVMDPEVVALLLRRRDILSALTPRERDVLRLMAEGRSNAAIAAHMVITEKAVSNHINALFAKLGLPPSSSDHRRVLAVLAYLDQ